jgi:putative DNA primase/helicase
MNSEFRAALSAAGLDFPGEIIPDGRLHRIKVNGDRNPNSFYVLHPDGIAAGLFGCWKRGISETWCAKSNEVLTEAERADRDRKWQQQQTERDAERRRLKDDARAKAQAILDAGQPATDDHPYLVRKGVQAFPCVKLGAWPQRQLENCLLIPLRTASGQLATVQAIFPAKPATGRDKDFLKGGTTKGAHFVIGDLHSADTIIIAEGYATAATLHEATGYAAVMAVDAGNLKPVAEALQVLYPGKRIIVAADNDRASDGNPGVKAATAAAKAIKATLAIPQFADGESGTDFNDLAALHGLDAVRDAIDKASQPGKRREQLQVPDDRPSASSEAKLAARMGVVIVKAGEYPEATDAAEKYLIEAQVGIFQRGVLCRISREPTATVRGITRPVGAVLIAALSETYLRDLLDRLVEWQKWDGKADDFRRCSVPPDIAKRLLSRAGMWRFPILTGIVTAPTLRPDGSLIDAPGYDKTTGLFLDFQGEQFPAIPDRPSLEQGRLALALLVREVLENRCIGDDENAGFSFASPAAKSAALSAILTALVRHTVPKAPLHLFSARKAGSGKSLLADAVALIATGRTATIIDLAEDGDEQEKRLLAVFMAGDAVINLDNVELPLGGSHLNKALTAETFTGRLLGLSQNATVPTTSTWLATGNNVIVKEDLTRRVVLCQLDPQTESPEKREFERSLDEWIPKNRPALVMAALTALRAYVVAGKPRQNIPVMGSFEDWHRLVRSALVWLGEADPLADTGEMESADPTRIRLRALISAWYNAFNSIPTTAKEAVARANSNMRDENGDEVAQDSLLRDVLTDHFTDGRKGGISSRFIGDFLSKIKGRIECGARFEAAGDYQRAITWRVNILDPRRFEDSTGESSESGESVYNPETFYSKNTLGEESNIKNKKNIPDRELTHKTHKTHQNPPNPAPPGRSTQAHPVATDPKARRIMEQLRAMPAGMTDEELKRAVCTDKGTSPALVDLTLTQLAKAGNVAKVNGRWVLMVSKP